MKKLALLAALALVPLAVPAHAQFGAKLGMLSCTVNGGTGFIIGSSKDMQCTFTPAFGSRTQEIYSGRINKYGVDIGTTTGGALEWLVLAPSRDVYDPGGLAGNYVGATAEATIAVGLGANVLVGGSARSIALQPLSVTNQTGLNAALAIGALQLTAPLK
ncbi:DUF992 domain-containing protein [Aminobacter aganoensis]|uniref:DUF992 domain-containing protein n=1 Tax=Aminobacter aganoensis TaxID=83264 RepID=A0A7X0F8Z3_9HYPH|nr:MULTISPECIES: DUF992 domain-containing protein [Aminobacter]KQU64894.1 hypothetical protein ASC75_12865 [Aminobacter sp. DSM 101952]MBB6355280.1 hypothetical protein [Aminobacter aganoensis]